MTVPSGVQYWLDQPKRVSAPGDLEKLKEALERLPWTSKKLGRSPTLRDVVDSIAKEDWHTSYGR